MQAKIIKIGNSKGLRIPNAMLKQCKLNKVVDIEVENNKLIITACNETRENWEQQFEQMVLNKDDRLLNDDIVKHSWDKEEWQW